MRYSLTDQCTRLAGSLLNLGSALIVAALLASCSTPTSLPPVDTRELEAQAASAMAAGNLAGAAEIFLRLARSTSGAQRAGFLIDAARLELATGNHAGAALHLDEAEGDATPVQLQLSAGVLARISLAEDRPEEALIVLQSMGEPLDNEVLIDRNEVLGAAYFSVGNVIEAISALSEREVWLDDTTQILANQTAIWNGLQEAGSAAVASPPTGDPVIDGWLALAQTASNQLTDADLRRELLMWRNNHVNHPAATTLLTSLLLEQRQEVSFPRQIALLLPLSSQTRDAALAIRDGFVAAHLESGRRRDSSIRVYDTAAAPDAYLRAQLDGAEFIVGPLLRDEVDAIVEHTGFIPTLALNYSQLETPAPLDFYQFALAPEDEAQAVARRAYNAGLRRAVAMVPSGQYGQRIFNSFRSAFELLGGQVVATTPYEPALQDYSSRITSVMNLDQSYQRQRRLAANLGVDLSFEPRRRQDVDMIFIYASAESGRLLAPQFNYYYAGDLPAYATSDIFNSTLGADNQDLNGIIFPDVPWLISPNQDLAAIRAELDRFWPRRSAVLRRLYGMGIDAYRFVEIIYKGQPIDSVDGASGRLSSDAQGRIHRDLPFAQFRNGQAVPLPAVDVPQLTTR